MASLPLLPGYSPHKHLGKEGFHKSHHFDFSNEMTMLEGGEKPGIGGEPLIGQKMKFKYSVYPKGKGSDLPSWVAFDKQALCFEAFFHETVPQAQEETFRIRKCKIFFYLEDDTIKVVEPELKNSGIPQGTLIRRHRIPLPPPNDDQFYNIFHFNINQEILLYSRKFTVTNCDTFTRNFLTKLGVRLNEPAAIPVDPYSQLREEREKSMKPLRPYEKHDTRKQFLENDSIVLCFYCFWDDTENLFGDVRELLLHYFLADDTITIQEVIPPNCGRDHVSKFLRRGKLPKFAPSQLRQPGAVTDRTVLNVFASSRQGKRYILDSLKCSHYSFTPQSHSGGGSLLAQEHSNSMNWGERESNQDVRSTTVPKTRQDFVLVQYSFPNMTGAIKEDFYKDCDLMIGTELNVWGRRVIISDCDEFTKNYYRCKFGIEDFTPVQYKAPPAPKPSRQMPPYNGFGSEEDSLSSCQGLLPKPPQKDFQKFMEKDRYGLEINVLNFRAKMVTEDPIDKDRVFIISFYLCDDSISVFERAQQNTGVLGGTFMGRCRVKKPGQELFKSELSKYFTAQDFYVGAVLCLHNRNFQLIDADEYAFNYMEKHAEEFPRANMGSILSKLRSIPEDKQKEIKTFLALSDPSNSGVIPYESFRGLLIDLECELSEHEVLVLARCFSEREQPELDVSLMLAVAQDFLKKKYFDEFSEMTKAFAHHDRKKTGHLSLKETRTICKAFQLPLAENLLTSLLNKFAQGDEIDYHAFIAAINWREHPAPPVMADDILKVDLVKSESGGVVERKINYSILLRDVFSGALHNTDPTTTSVA